MPNLVGLEIKKRMISKMVKKEDSHPEGFGDIINEKTGKKYFPDLSKNVHITVKKPEYGGKSWLAKEMRKRIKK